MVDVGAKAATRREAEAEAKVFFSAAAFERIQRGDLPKGALAEPARLAGILAAKRTSEWIPLCHPLFLDSVSVDIRLLPEAQAMEIRCTARCTGKTGVEMEAMVGAAAAALTVYDMTKALDKGSRIEGLRLLRKSGGKSGEWQAQ